MSNWYSFESIVGKLVSLRPNVKKIVRDANLAGHQVDYYIEEESSLGSIVKTAVEVKYSQREITSETVAEFGYIINFLRGKKIIDLGILVAYNGFTKPAFDVANKQKVELLSFASLEIQANTYGPIAKFIAQAKKEPPPEAKKKLIFVLMPFSEDLKDTYLYGIRGAAEKTGYICLRADEIEHNSDILQQILYYIQKAEVLIAEGTDRNPNVYYEIGIAHGKNKDVILLTKHETSIPFDLKGKNHIIYATIHDLEEKLVKRLKGLELRK
jgi:hypothetical protein